MRQAWREQQPITQRQLAAQFGISQTMVSQILAQISWPDVQDGP
jgi:transcriptional regulator with XRE-family HTH domain